MKYQLLKPQKIIFLNSDILLRVKSNFDLRFLFFRNRRKNFFLILSLAVNSKLLHLFFIFIFFICLVLNLTFFSILRIYFGKRLLRFSQKMPQRSVHFLEEFDYWLVDDFFTVQLCDLRTQILFDLFDVDFQKFRQKL